jgi:hypothetical protein
MMLLHKQRRHTGKLPIHGQLCCMGVVRVSYPIRCGCGDTEIFKKLEYVDTYIVIYK